MMNAQSIMGRPFQQPSFGCEEGVLSSGTDDIDDLTPEAKRQKQELDDMLAQAKNGLTFEERQEQQEIVHGVHHSDVEDEAFVSCALKDLDHYLSRMKQGSCYELAEQKDPDYVHAKPFRVMFLRAKEYDPEASADLMLRFFDLKHRLFGLDKLTKDIEIEDLSEADLVCLKTGVLQMVGRDRSGRQILLHLGCFLGNTPFKTVESDMRIHYFVIMNALKSEQTQIGGIVSIWYAVGDLRNANNGSGYSESFKASSALPQKKAAIHLCTDKLHQALICKAVIGTMNDNMRARFVLHFGSPMECQYRLSTYGVLPESLPLDVNGCKTEDRNGHWVQCCIMNLSMSPMKKDNLDPSHTQTLGKNSVAVIRSKIAPPGPNDVVFIGVKSRKHVGTQRFQELVGEYAQTYDSATDETKRKIVSTIIARTCESGGRFLKKDRRAAMLRWEEVPHDELRSKVMQAFRNRRRRFRLKGLKHSMDHPIDGHFAIQGTLRSNINAGMLPRRSP